MVQDLPGYWRSRWLFEKGLAAVYLIAFVAVLDQFLPLVGAHGLLPATDFIAQVPFRYSPSIFYWIASDRVFLVGGWVGAALALLAFSGLPQRFGASAAAVVWLLLYVLYLSYINVGQTFFAFGWESLLVEVGFYTILAGAFDTAPSRWLNWIYRWTLFRMMFGAGLIKLRGDACWRDLTCLDYFFETQPMPNPASWYIHHLPNAVLHGGVVVNHIVELVVPFAFLLPQPYAGVAGLATIGFQMILIAGGNLSWLNWLTVVLAVSTLDDRFLKWLPVRVPALRPVPWLQRTSAIALAIVVAVLSVPPVLNMLSPGQVMNTSFNPLQIVNTYGAFGSVTRERYEIVVEGTADEALSDGATWREYEFRAKPTDPGRQPPQIAPYHLRLDWLMWFAAMGSPSDYPFFPRLMLKLLEGDAGVLHLIRGNPFPQAPPRWVRAELYLYRFTTPEERRRTGRWWDRTLVGSYFPPVRLPASGAH